MRMRELLELAELYDVTCDEALRMVKEAEKDGEEHDFFEDIKKQAEAACAE